MLFRSRRVELERGPEVAKEVLTFSSLECTDEVEDFVVLLWSRSYVSDTLQTHEYTWHCAPLSSYMRPHRYTSTRFLPVFETREATYARTAVTRTARKAMRFSTLMALQSRDTSEP